MSGFLCDEYPAGATIYALFHSFDSNGASITLTGLATTDIEIYKNGSTTQRASDSGYALLDTDGIDFDSITGIHGISIDLSDNTDSGFFAAGSQYTVVLSSVTIDTRTVNLVLGSFRIRAAEASAGVPAVGVSSIANNAITAASIADNAIDAGAIAADAITAAKIADGAIDAATFAANAITSTVIADDAITAAKIATNAIDADALAADAIAEINATVDTALADYDGPTHAELVSGINAVQIDIAALNDLSAAEVNAEMVDALATDTYAEPTGVPSATASLAQKIGTVYMMARNRVDVSATKKTFYDDGGSAEFEKDLSDDGTTYSESEANAI